MTSNAAALSEISDIKNVYIYVGDAVRWDHLDERIEEMGTNIKTVASSIHSPTSFASLATGMYPPTHGVFSFTNRIDAGVQSPFDLEGYQTRFVNSIGEESDEDPIFSVLDQPVPKCISPFDDLSSPFVVMERGPGGHAPYGEFDGTAPQYFENTDGLDVDTVRTDYEMTVSNDTDRFLKRLSVLEERGLLDETLVIYTSDHGELLGEGGMLGHNSPMRPELVYVPTVFVHPELTRRTITDSIFRHVDLLPTVLDVLGEDDAPPSTDGESLFTSGGVATGCTFYKSSFISNEFPGLTGVLHYEGVWDANGGEVFARSSLLDRLTILAGKLLQSSKRSFLRSYVLHVARSYWRGDWSYGKPEFSRQTAAEKLKSVKSRRVEQQSVEISDEAEEHLEAMGYK